MEDHPDPRHDKAPPRRSRRGLRWAILALALILAAFHRPLIFKGARFAAISFAASRHLALDFQIGGGLYGNLVLEKISAKATGPGVVQELAAESVEFNYSLPDLIRKGRTELIKSVAARDVRVVLDPAKATIRERTRPIQMPRVFPKQVEIRGASLLVRDRAGDWEIANGMLTLYPDRPGMLGIGKLKLPGGREFNQLAAATSYRGMNLVLKELEIGPEVRIGEFNLDLTKVDRGKLGLRMQADLFKGRANLAATLTRKTGSANADVKLSGTGISLESATGFLGLEAVGGSIVSFKSRVSGDVNRPASWTGAVSAEAVDLKWEKVAIDHAKANIDLGEDKACLVGFDLKRAQSTMAIHGSATLPEHLGPIEEATGDYAICIPMAGEIGADFGVPDASGAVGAGGGLPAFL